MMPYLSAAIVVLALSIFLASQNLSRAIARAAGILASALREIPGTIDRTVSLQPTQNPMGPDPGFRIGASSSLDEMAEARLEIQKRAFDVPPLVAVGGQVAERMGSQDIVGISRGINKRVEKDER